MTGSSANNFIASKTSAPWAFTTNVIVSSEIGFWLDLVRTTETGTPTNTRWLRRWVFFSPTCIENGSIRKHNILIEHVPMLSPKAPTRPLNSRS